MYSYYAAAFFFVVFLISFIRDRRRLRNGIYLVLTLMFTGIGVIFTLAEFSREAVEIMLAAVAVLLMFFIGALAIFLVGNGFIMLRREGFRLANLLSLCAGLGIFAFIFFYIATDEITLPIVVEIKTILLILLGYFSFLFVCFLLYAFFYGYIRHSRKIDFIVVLGSSLLGDRIPPLLASRLDRAHTAFNTICAKGKEPLFITSGGQGSDEKLPEAQAMADYLVTKGVPRDRIIVEDKSRSTTENLQFSRDIMLSRRTKYRCLIVTNNFHAFRTALLANKLKVRGQVVGSPTAFYFWPSAIIREFIAILVQHRYLNGFISLGIVVAGLL